MMIPRTVRSLAGARQRSLAVHMFRRGIALHSEGPWIYEDDMSVTHAKNLDVTLQSYLPAESTPNSGDAVAPGAHLVFFNHRVLEPQLNADGYDDLQSPIGNFPNRRWFGGSIEFNIGTQLNLGEPAVCTESIYDIKESVNNKRVKVTIDRQMKNVGSDEPWAVRELRSMFYFAHDPELVKRQFKRHYRSQYTPKYSQKIHPSKILLFRYSALNFNAHLIHYDQVYTRGAEELPDVIVQGPLMVTMMLRWFSNNVLGENSGRMIRQFSYRNMAPLSVNEEAVLCAAPITQDTMEVWIENGKGGVVLTGTVAVA